MKNKHIIKTLLTLAVPMILQNFLHSSLTFLDTFMIGQLGDQAVAAAGIAGQLLFIFSIIQFGIHSGITVLSSQYWGKKDLDAIKHLLGIQLSAGMIPVCIFILIFYVFPFEFVSLYTEDPQIARWAVSYLRLTGLSLFFTVLVYSYTFNLRSAEITALPLIASIISVLINLVLNYLLIFGKMGFPELGIKGAAIGTSAARITEALFLVLFVYVKKYPSAAKLREMFSFSKGFLKSVFKVSYPVFLNELFWVLGVGLYNWIYSKLGTESLAAVNIVFSIENFAFTPFFGLFSAGAVILGNKIGEGKKSEAYLYGRVILYFQFYLALITGLVLFFFRELILSFYQISSVTRFNAENLMTVICLIMAARVLNYTFNVSIFRGGGDTRFSLFLDFSGVWLIGIPMALTGAFILELPVYYVMSLAVLEEIYKVILALRRFRSEKWIRSLI